MVVNLSYCVVFGKCDGSDWFGWTIELTRVEAQAYRAAIAAGISPNDVPALQGALDRAYYEIRAEEEENNCDCGDDYALESLGRYPVDPDEINDLVAARDPHALEFFGLQNATDAELEDWDAFNIEMPNVCDFDPDFEPCSPFERGWDLHVMFAEEEEDALDSHAKAYSLDDGNERESEEIDAAHDEDLENEEIEDSYDEDSYDEDEDE